MEKDENTPDRVTRMGIRIAPEVFERLELMMPHLKREARKVGERMTQQIFVEEAIVARLDFLERKGETIASEVEEILTNGNARHRRALEVHVRELLEEVRAASEKRQPKQGA